MSPNLYLAIMLVIIIGITVAVLPSLLTKKCPQCGTRNGLDARTCKKCGAAFPEDDAED